MKVSETLFALLMGAVVAAPACNTTPSATPNRLTVALSPNPLAATASVFYAHPPGGQDLAVWLGSWTTSLLAKTDTVIQKVAFRMIEDESGRVLRFGEMEGGQVGPLAAGVPTSLAQGFTVLATEVIAGRGYSIRVAVEGRDAAGAALNVEASLRVTFN